MLSFPAAPNSQDGSQAEGTAAGSEQPTEGATPKEATDGSAGDQPMSEPGEQAAPPEQDGATPPEQSEATPSEQESSGSEEKESPKTEKKEVSLIPVIFFHHIHVHAEVISTRLYLYDSQLLGLSHTISY